MITFPFLRILASIFFFAALVSFDPQASICQTDTTETPRPNSLKAGSWAMMVQIEGAVRFSGYLGTVSGKYHITNNEAVRIGISFNTYADIENKNDDNTRSYSSLGLSIQYVHYPKSTATVLLFFGGGAFFENRRETDKNEVIGTSEYSNSYLGLSALLGAEWFATK